MKAREARKKLHIAFCHPDLGLGGAERLIVDAAAELAARGHDVTIYTAHHDPNRCFQETTSGVFRVQVYGDWFPRSILGRFMALCAYMRCILVALGMMMLMRTRRTLPDVIITDQVSIVHPIFRLLSSSLLLYYCHFPDLLLSSRSSIVKRLYRYPLDALEQATTSMAHKILVNSKFTQTIFAQTFRRIHVTPVVLYPAVQIPPRETPSRQWKMALQCLPPQLARVSEDGVSMFLSINRFERKKNLSLALRAVAELRRRNQKTPPPPHVHLVMAGGYDARLPENVQYLDELRREATELGIQNLVTFLPSFRDEERVALLTLCTAVLYTPALEHFGIVPLEAMAAGRPVIACNSGGPLESIVHDATGYLVDATPAAFAEAMERLLVPGVAARLGVEARRHVEEHFSRTAFGERLEEMVQDMMIRGGGVK